VTGELAILAPALGTSQALLNADHRQIYFAGMPALNEGKRTGAGWALRRHADAFERLPGGAYRALGRVDDTMNLGGIKVGSGASVGEW
jgi:acetyl-CoA synthetase